MTPHAHRIVWRPSQVAALSDLFNPGKVMHDDGNS
jgi:hypothetical protein